MKKVMSKKLLVFCLAATAVCMAPLAASAVDKLVVKDTADQAQFIVTDDGKVGVGIAATPAIALHVSASEVAVYEDQFGMNQVSGTGTDIQTTTGAPPEGPIQAVNNQFLIRYQPGVPITNNFNTFRMFARTDGAVADDFTGHITAANFQAQHCGTGNASRLVGLIANVACSVGHVDTAEAIQAASPGFYNGTIDKAIGVHIQTQNIERVTAGYGIYQEGATDLNYFQGNIGIGVTAPTQPIQLAGGAYSNGTTWVNASSRELKENINDLSAEDALNALEELTPVTYNYKVNADDSHVGFIAEDVPAIVATPDRKGLEALDVVALLTKVVQEQSKAMETLQVHINKLEMQLQTLENKGTSLVSLK